MDNVKNLKYSAGIVSKGFWFQEFKKYNHLLSEGYNDNEIKEMQEKNNILLAPSADYGKRMINEVSKRTKAMPNEISSMFVNLPVSDQKILNILGVMLTDRLFFEFMYEVYREKLIIGNLQFEDSDIRVFLKNKSEQNEKVADYKPYTKKRLATAYQTYLREAGLLIENNNTLMFKKSILDINLENQMKINLYPYLRVLLGE